MIITISKTILIIANFLLSFIFVFIARGSKDKQTRTGTGILLSVLIADIVVILGGMVS